MGLRLAVIIGGAGLLYSALAFNVYHLQVAQGEYYAARAQAQQSAGGQLRARRGTIFFTDKNNNRIPVALNKKYPTIFAVPEEVGNKEDAAARVSAVLGLEEGVVLNAFRKPGDQYELLRAKATPAEVDAIERENIEGMYIIREEYRFYPFGELGAHVLGFVGENEHGFFGGQYGVERFFEETLAGTHGSAADDKITDPIDGSDIVLTIDRNIQARAEEILGDLVSRYRAVSGTAIVQNPKTGAILAMVSTPTFDPNEYPDYALRRFPNPAVEGLYEPGSVFKVMTMAAGLDSGKVTPDMTYYDKGSLILNGRTIKNWDLEKYGPHGRVGMSEIIERSINTGAVFVQQQMGQDIFYNYLRKFGFEELTGVALPNELAGRLNNLRTSFRDINFATASFGQGVAVTPLELIAAISAIANDGVLMRSYITAETKPEMVRRVVGARAADETTVMMVSAVKGARVAAIPNYNVAGKTGTALVPDFTRGGYTDEVINTYVGFAPANDPAFAILIKIDKPAGAPLAGETVVPAFRELAHFILNYYNIPPDNLQ